MIVLIASECVDSDSLRCECRGRFSFKKATFRSSRAFPVLCPISRRKLQGVGRKVKGVGRKVQGVGRKVKGVGRKVQGVGRKVQGVGRS